MPDNITFNTIPIDIRTPGQFLEVDNSKALTGLPNMNRRMLFIGNKLVAGSAAANTLQRIIDDMVTVGMLKHPIAVEAVLRDDAVKQAYDDLKDRPELQAAIAKAKSVVEKYGF